MTEQRLRAVDEHLAQCTQDPAILVLRGNDEGCRRALALNWAIAHRDRFTGGMLYASAELYRTPKGDVEVKAVVAALLLSLGVRSHDIPKATVDRVNLYRRRTARVPLLVLVDGADEPAQVRSVIPAAAGSVVIATTSLALSGLTIDGAAYLDMEG